MDGAELKLKLTITDPPEELIPIAERMLNIYEPDSDEHQLAAWALERLQYPIITAD